MFVVTIMTLPSRVGHRGSSWIDKGGSLERDANQVLRAPNQRARLFSWSSLEWKLALIPGSRFPSPRVASWLLRMPIESRGKRRAHSNIASISGDDRGHLVLAETSRCPHHCRGDRDCRGWRICAT